MAISRYRESAAIDRGSKKRILVFSVKFNLGRSISHLGDDTRFGSCTIICYSNVNISSINNSHSNVHGSCIFAIVKVYYDSIISFSTFSSNEQKIDSGTIEAVMNGGSIVNFRIRLCNFFDNNGSTNSELLGCNHLNTIVSNCDFKGNTGNTYRFGTYSINSSMTVEFCYIDVEQPNWDRISYKNNLTSDFAASLSHFSSFECDAKIPKLFNHHKIKEKESLYELDDMVLFILSQFEIFTQ